MEQQLLENTLSWMAEVVESARTEAKAGNLIPLNALGRNPALSFYIDNVSSGLLTETEFAVQFPNYVKEGARLHEQYQLAASAGGDLPGRVGKLEEAIATLPNKIAEALKAAGITVNVTESETPPADDPPAEPAPVKPAPAKSKKPADAPPPVDPAAPPAADPTSDPPADPAGAE